MDINFTVPEMQMKFKRMINSLQTTFVRAVLIPQPYGIEAKLQFFGWEEVLV